MNNAKATPASMQILKFLSYGPMTYAKMVEVSGSRSMAAALSTMGCKGKDVVVSKTVKNESGSLSFLNVNEYAITEYGLTRLKKHEQENGNVVTPEIQTYEYEMRPIDMAKEELNIYRACSIIKFIDWASHRSLPKYELRNSELLKCIEGSARNLFSPPATDLMNYLFGIIANGDTLVHISDFQEDGDYVVSVSDEGMKFLSAFEENHGTVVFDELKFAHQDYQDSLITPQSLAAGAQSDEYFNWRKPPVPIGPSEEKNNDSGVDVFYRDVYELLLKINAFGNEFGTPLQCYLKEIGSLVCKNNESINSIVVPGRDGNVCLAYGHFAGYVRITDAGWKYSNQYSDVYREQNRKDVFNSYEPASATSKPEPNVSMSAMSDGLAEFLGSVTNLLTAATSACNLSEHALKLLAEERTARSIENSKIIETAQKAVDNLSAMETRLKAKEKELNDSLKEMGKFVLSITAATIDSATTSNLIHNTGLQPTGGVVATEEHIPTTTKAQARKRLPKVVVAGLKPIQSARVVQAFAKELNVVCWSSFDGANTFNGLIKEADAVFIHTAHTSHQITEMASKFQNLRMINVPGGYSGMLTAIRAYLKEQ